MEVSIWVIWPKFGHLVCYNRSFGKSNFLQFSEIFSVKFSARNYLFLIPISRPTDTGYLLVYQREEITAASKDAFLTK